MGWPECIAFLGLCCCWMSYVWADLFRKALENTVKENDRQWEAKLEGDRFR